MLGTVSLFQTGEEGGLPPTPQFRFDSCAVSVQRPRENSSVLTFLVLSLFYLGTGRRAVKKQTCDFSTCYGQTHSSVPLRFEIRSIPNADHGCSPNIEEGRPVSHCS